MHPPRQSTIQLHCLLKVFCEVQLPEESYGNNTLNVFSLVYVNCHYIGTSVVYAVMLVHEMLVYVMLMQSELGPCAFMFRADT